jgi:hypothetical protein
MVEFVREDAAEGAVVSLFAVFGGHGEEIFLDEAPDALAIDLGEREDDAFTNVGAAERAGIGAVGLRPATSHLPLNVITANSTQTTLL